MTINRSKYGKVLLAAIQLRVMLIFIFLAVSVIPSYTFIPSGVSELSHPVLRPQFGPNVSVIIFIVKSQISSLKQSHFDDCD